MGALKNTERMLLKLLSGNGQKRPKPAKLAINIPLKSLVIEKLQLKWSPEQISGWLKNEFPFLNDGTVIAGTPSVTGEFTATDVDGDTLTWSFRYLKRTGHALVL